MSSTDRSRQIRVLVVDDHPVLREGVAAIVHYQADMTVVGEAETGVEAIERFRELKPDITLMDLQMPEMGGVEAIRTIREEFPSARIIVLTTYSGDAQALRALKAGAVGFLLKSALRREMVDTIRAAHAGRRHIPPEVATEIAFHAAEEPLSDRELAVLRLVAAGQANKEIARELAISEETVKGHLKSIFAKLDVGDRTQAAITAAKRGIIDI